MQVFTVIQRGRDESQIEQTVQSDQCLCHSRTDMQEDENDDEDEQPFLVTMLNGEGKHNDHEDWKPQNHQSRDLKDHDENSEEIDVHI